MAYVLPCGLNEPCGLFRVRVGRLPSAAPTLSILVHWFKRIQGVKRARPRPNDTLLQPMFGEWLSLVEHLVRDQGVGGSNPLSPTNKINNLH
jgi:hypothetical protein